MDFSLISLGVNNEYRVSGGRVRHDVGDSAMLVDRDGSPLMGPDPWALVCVALVFWCTGNAILPLTRGPTSSPTSATGKSSAKALIDCFHKALDDGDGGRRAANGVPFKKTIGTVEVAGA